MEYTIRTISGEAELEAVGRLRYAVYTGELDRRPTGIDDDRGVVIDAEDAISTIHAAFAGDELVAAFRSTPIHRLPDDSPWRGIYDVARFPVAEEAQVMLSRLVVDSRHRHSLVAPQLFAAAYDAGRAEGVEVSFILSSPNLVPLYQVLGFRRYRSGVSEGDAGFRLPMTMITGDWAHFEAVKSPFIEGVHRYPPNVSLGDWFEQTFPEHSRPSSVRVLTVDEFLRQFAERLTDPGIPLLDDLDGDDKQRLFLAADNVDAAAGQVLLRKGGGGTEMYLVLDGAVEVSIGEGNKRRVLTTLGAGQLFGEAGFLMKTPRSADVTAITDSHLLALGVEGFDRLSQEDPAAAVKLLRNLSRMLCLRLYAGNAE